MLATKADIISGMVKAIQETQDERDMLDLSEFSTMSEFWKIEDEYIAIMDDLYIEIGKVLKNQDIVKYARG